jgi:hypothetical protein
VVVQVAGAAGEDEHARVEERSRRCCTSARRSTSTVGPIGQLWRSEVESNKVNGRLGRGEDPTAPFWRNTVHI